MASGEFFPPSPLRGEGGRTRLPPHGRFVLSSVMVRGRPGPFSLRGGVPVAVETLLPPTPKVNETGTQTGSSDRRADIDAKMVRVAALLQEVGCEGLLLRSRRTWPGCPAAPPPAARSTRRRRP